MTPDLINGLFEALGAVSIWAHVRAIAKAKSFKGVSPFATAFFTSWGFWNLYYYPHLNQWLSFTAGIAIVVGNSVWLAMMWKYRKGSQADGEVKS